VGNVHAYGGDVVDLAEQAEEAGEE